MDVIAYPQPVTKDQVCFYYNLPESGRARIVIYNIVGEKMTSLEKEGTAAGAAYVVWPVNHVAPGVYLYRLEWETSVSAERKESGWKKLVVTKK